MGIPAGLLVAISIIESGKKAKGHDDLVAWPWVLNVKGRPEYYKTKTDAVKAMSKHLDQGTVNIDVGCMQINFRHHGGEFRSPSYMLDPRRNVAYAAKFLGALRKRYGSWTKAVGHYHSATLKHQVPYRHKVYRKWQKVRHDQKKNPSEQKRSLSLAEMSVQARRLLAPATLRKTLPNKTGPNKVRPNKAGYEVIRPQKPLVRFKKVPFAKISPAGSRKGSKALVHPNDRPYEKPARQASLAARMPHFFKN